MNKTKHEGDSRTQISQKRGRGNKHKTKGAPNKGRNKTKTQDKKKKQTQRILAKERTIRRRENKRDQSRQHQLKYEAKTRKDQ